MPIHDWTRVGAGVFHHFHHSWVEELKRALNNQILPPEFYAISQLEAVADNWPEILPQPGPTEESDIDFYRRKQTVVAVRHIKRDRLVAVIEVVSPGNKHTSRAVRSFVEEAAELLDRGVHLLILDLLPNGTYAPQGIHGAIWERVTDEEGAVPSDKPLTLVSYVGRPKVTAYVEGVAVGDELADMPLFLDPEVYCPGPLEVTYRAAFAAVPRRWRAVLEAPAD